MRNPSRDSPGARRISPAHVGRLRALVARAGSVAAARVILASSCELVEDALTGRVFRRTTAERLEVKIDELSVLAPTREDPVVDSLEDGEPPPHAAALMPFVVNALLAYLGGLPTAGAIDPIGGAERLAEAFGGDAPRAERECGSILEEVMRDDESWRLSTLEAICAASEERIRERYPEFPAVLAAKIASWYSYQWR
jgi:hypothetical protein